MGFLKEDRRRKVLRWIKTLFFLISMLISLLLFSAPIVIVIADTLLPSLLLFAPQPSVAISEYLNNYDFRYSLIDIPLISIVRSVIVLCVYSLCDGPRLSRGPYLGIATICSVSSLVFVSFKASYVFAHNSSMDRAMEMTLFVCSLALAVAHVVVAYRISCRERRKLLVYKIDIEAVSAFKTGSFYRYLKVIPNRKTEVKLKSTESICT
ncbi:unnamed protein product [Withania somnifera]